MARWLGLAMLTVAVVGVAMAPMLVASAPAVAAPVAPALTPDLSGLSLALAAATGLLASGLVALVTRAAAR